MVGSQEVASSCRSRSVSRNAAWRERERERCREVRVVGSSLINDWIVWCSREGRRSVGWVGWLVV